MKHGSKNSCRNSFQRTRWPDLVRNRCMAVKIRPICWSFLRPCINADVHNYTNILHLGLIACHRFIADMKSHQWWGRRKDCHRGKHKYSDNPSMILDTWAKKLERSCSLKCGWIRLFLFVGEEAERYQRRQMYVLGESNTKNLKCLSERCGAYDKDGEVTLVSETDSPTWAENGQISTVRAEC